jgi:hypothetical protein
MADTNQFSDQDILAMTAIGESESRGEAGMTQTVCTVMNRVKANLLWMGGDNARSVCLARNQYDCWWPQTGNPDRQRILDIALNDRAYDAFVVALGIAASALAGDLVDITNGAVSYGDDGERPEVHPGSEPCLADGDRVFFGLEAVA